MAIRKPPTNIETKKISEREIDQFIKGKDTGQGSEQISLRIPRNLLDAIDLRANELSISRAAFIKQSCARILENEH